MFAKQLYNTPVPGVFKPEPIAVPDADELVHDDLLEQGSRSARRGLDETSRVHVNVIYTVVVDFLEACEYLGDRRKK